ncbi:MAG: hypothetical protein DWQ42_02605 [Planctomycetota bacterium]|nr:MAG: hypothetical protein DWQ42_02605 [Planctomycetota bacterium]REK43470.1 MAG: hypothetical protein DWQ46_11205 [Planctomycetota bacterium]
MSGRLALISLCVFLLLGAHATVEAQPNQRQQQQQRPRGPTPEEIFRLLIPQEDLGDDDDRYDERDYRPPPRRAAPPRLRVPSAAEVAEMSHDQMRATLRAALQMLDERFNSMDVGAGWKKFLRTEELGSHLWANREAAPDRVSRSVLQDISGKFDDIAQESRFRFLRNAVEFQAIQRVLPVYAQSRVDRQRGDVRNSAAGFKTALDRTSNGAGWIRYLEIANVQRIAQANGPVSDDDQAILRAIAEKFQEIAEGDQYPLVRRMNGFTATRQSVAQLLDAIETERDDDGTSARSVMGKLVLDLEALEKHCHQESEALETLKLAPQGSEEADQASDILRAIKEARAKQKEEAMARLARLIRGEERRRDAMGKLVLDVDAMKEEADAAATLVLAPRGSRDEEKAREALEALILAEEEKRKDRAMRVERLIASVVNEEWSSSAMGSKSLADSESEDGKLKLIQPGVPEEDEAEEKIYLIQPGVPSDAEGKKELEEESASNSDESNGSDKEASDKKE